MDLPQTTVESSTWFVRRWTIIASANLLHKNKYTKDNPLPEEHDSFVEFCPIEIPLLGGDPQNATDF